MVPDLNLRLCSPQSYFLETKGGELHIRGTESLFQWRDGSTMTIPYDSRCNLPIAGAYSRNELGEIGTQLTTCVGVTDVQNQNLSNAQKQLLHWHWRLRHVGFK